METIDFGGHSEEDLHRWHAAIAHELNQRVRGRQNQTCETEQAAPAKTAFDLDPRFRFEGGQRASSGRAALTLETVDDVFTYHAWDMDQVARGDVVREALVAAAKAALRAVPDGPDRSAGLRKLREARMDFNSAITHHGRY
jgi:hypothetical protein